MQEPGNTNGKPRRRRWLRRVIWLSLLVVVVGVVGSWMTFSRLIAPYPKDIGDPPADVPAQRVEFEDVDRRMVRGWLWDVKDAKSTVLLMHALGGDRRAMNERARFLVAAGHACLWIDLHAHGESDGRFVSFGHFESDSAEAAVTWLRSRFPKRKVGVLGISLGGAAALLGDGPVDADAMILEQVYSTIERAIDNRVRMRVGPFATLLAPMLLVQAEPRFGLRSEDLRPAARMAKVRCPVFVIGGREDRHAQPDEIELLFERATATKELWIVDGAAHDDIHRRAKTEYERRVRAFFEKHLN